MCEMCDGGMNAAADDDSRGDNRWNDDWRNEHDSGTVIRLPEHVSPAFKALITSAAPAAAAALRRQVLSSDDELVVSEEERGDPLGEARYCVTPYLVHQ